MSLAIETPRGQKSLEYERECISMFCNLYPQYKFLETDKHSPAAIDGIMYLHRDGIMTAAVEVKCSHTSILSQLSTSRPKARDAFSSESSM